nr:uncharacterized protein CTRU02_07226 [Colletotrichum truncatum]KAF6791464.1 hypothetical protein CTRU02_07226 [Colletotrichum truncatum]
MAELDRNLYTVAWIAPLEIEAQAALHMLDQRHHGRFPISRGDDYVFHAGCICGHNVVVATLPAGQEYGTGSAAALASQVRKSFPHLWFGLLVGVAAGLPNFARTPTRDIRLGDVLVALPDGESAGLVAYDLGKETGADGFQPLRFGHVLANTETVVRSAIGSIKLNVPNDAEVFLPYYEAMKHQEHATGNFTDPGQHKDKLFDINSRGKEEEVQRPARPSSKRTRVWYGPIGSGEKLMRNARQRNELRDKYNVIGLEMEAAGTMNRIPVGVIRGVCDYGDEHKNKEWQPYAAAMAAAYAKAILREILPELGDGLSYARKMSQDTGTSESTDSFTRPDTSNELWPECQNERPGLTARFLKRNDTPSQLLPDSELWHSVDRRTPQTVVIYGLSGVGKSQMCLHAITENEKRFRGIFYIDASNDATADRNYLDISRVCHVQNHWEGIELDEQIRITRAWLACQKDPWLLMVDNADSTNLYMDRYIPTGGPGTVLITTTDERYAMCGHTFCKIDVMSNEEAVNLLMKYKRPGTDLDAGEIDAARTLAVKVLGGLPLAIAQAGSYIFNKYCTYAEYCREFSESPKAPLSYDDQPEQWSRRRQPIWKTFTLSLYRIQSLPEICSVEAVELLRTLSFLHHDAISEHMFQEAWQNMKNDSPLSRAITFLNHESSRWDTPILKAAFGTLCRYSLLNLASRGSRQYSMHNLVNTMCKESMSSEEKKKHAFRAASIIATALSGIKATLSWIDDPSGFDLQKSLLPHIKACITGRIEILVQEPGEENRQIGAKILLLFAKAYSATGHFNDAVNLLNEGCPLVLKRSGSGRVLDSTSLQVMEQLAACQTHLGQHWKARNLRRFIVDKLAEAAQPNVGERCAAAMNLADSLWATGQRKEALKKAQEVLHLREKYLAAGDPRLRRTRRKVAEYLHGTDQRLQALQMRQDVYTQTGAQSDISEVERLDILASTNALADSYHWYGRLLEALRLRQEVYDGRLSILGTQHPDTWLAQDRLLGTKGSLAASRYELLEICQQREELVRTWRQAFGDLHPQTLETKVNLGHSYSAAHRWSRALEQQNDVLKIRTSHFQQHTPPVKTQNRAAFTGNVANILTKTRRLDEAIMMRKRAVKTAEEYYGPNDPVTFKLSNNLVSCYPLTPDTSTINSRELILKRQFACLPRLDPGILKTLSLLAADLSKLPSTSDSAIRIRETLIEAQKTVLGLKNRETVNNMKKLAIGIAIKSLRSKKDITRAVALMKDVEQIYTEFLGRKHLQTRDTKIELLCIYECVGRHRNLTKMIDLNTELDANEDYASRFPLQGNPLARDPEWLSWHDKPSDDSTSEIEDETGPRLTSSHHQRRGASWKAIYKAVSWTGQSLFLEATMSKVTILQKKAKYIETDYNKSYVNKFQARSSSDEYRGESGSESGMEG